MRVLDLIPANVWVLSHKKASNSLGFILLSSFIWSFFKLRFLVDTIYAF